MFALLRGLLSRPRVTIEYILKNPNIQQASQLNFLIVALFMVNTVFLIATDPQMDQMLGFGKWFLAFLLPPFEFWLQRLLFIFSARLGIAMFSSSSMPRDPYEKRAKLAHLKMVYPYIIYPTLFLSIISSAFDSFGVEAVFMMIGAIYTLVLSAFAIKTLFGVSTAVAFWGPLFVQILIAIAAGVIVGVIVLILVLLKLTTFAP